MQDAWTAITGRDHTGTPASTRIRGCRDRAGRAVAAKHPTPATVIGPAVCVPFRSSVPEPTIVPPVCELTPVSASRPAPIFTSEPLPLPAIDPLKTVDAAVVADRQRARAEHHRARALQRADRIGLTVEVERRTRRDVECNEIAEPAAAPSKAGNAPLQIEQPRERVLAGEHEHRTRLV